jgi:small subunit ribosomal protein S16
VAVRIRLSRTGRKNQPYYRIVVAPAQAKRDGRILENVGYYDPRCKEVAKQVVVKSDRIEYWRGVGAQPSETVERLLKRIGAK